MTITTAKLPSRWPASAGRALTLTPLALAALLLSNECRAQWRVTPSIDLRETYSDNVNNQVGDQAQSGFVTDASPRISVSGNGPRLRLNATAEWHRYDYSSDDIPNVRNSERRYNAGAQFTAVKELLYVDASANAQRQAVSAFGPLSDNSFSNINNTEIRTWSISPYLRHRFGSTATLLARYSRDSVSGGSGVGFGNTTSNTRSANLASGTSFVNIGWDLNYSHQDLQAQNAGGTSSENTVANLQWRVLPLLSLTASAGYDKYEYAVINQVTAGKSWSAGFIWQPTTHTRVQASYGRRYFGNTGSLDATYRTRHTTWRLNYNDSVTTTRQQFLIPSTLDTAATLDAMFAAAYPDPIERQQAVQAYIASAGLPTSLTNNINYLSNRYIRQKRLQGQFALRGSRSDLLLTAFSEQSIALSLLQEDSSLLPSQLSNLNDSTRQRGVNATADYRLSPRTTAQANANFTHAESVSTGIANNYRSVSVSLSRHFAEKINGALELRHSNGRAGTFDSSNYHENAIVASISVRY
jgi:uncharacterized protein (PEP-CTERM system associated)